MKKNHDPQLVRRQIQLFDLYGSLCAELENVLALLGARVDPQYALYRRGRPQRLALALDNVAGFLAAIEQFRLVARGRLQRLRLPAEPQPDIARWVGQLAELETGDAAGERRLALAVLRFALDGMQTGRVEALPEALEDQILAEEVSPGAAATMARDGQQAVLRINTQAQSLADQTSEQLNKYENEDFESIVFNKNKPYLSHETNQ